MTRMQRMTPLERGLARQAYLEGMEVREIATALHRGVSAIYSTIRLWKQYRPRRIRPTRRITAGTQVASSASKSPDT